MDAFVPISIGFCTNFIWDQPGKWVFARWLVEVSMDANGI
jgi:hypothetical protein